MTDPISLTLERRPYEVVDIVRGWSVAMDAILHLPDDYQLVAEERDQLAFVGRLVDELRDALIDHLQGTIRDLQP